jgi:hypothetical protein
MNFVTGEMHCDLSISAHRISKSLVVARISMGEVCGSRTPVRVSATDKLDCGVQTTIKV